MIKQDKTEMILNGSVYKILFNLSIPIIINSIIQTLYDLVDGLYIGMISTVHFAATAFVWPVNFLFISLGMGFSVAGTSLISQLVGKGNLKRGEEYASQLILITFLSSILFTIIGYIISPHIIKLMGATGEFAEYANIYLRISFLNLPFMFFYFNINSIMNAQGNTVTPTILSGISAIINIILDPIFIFTFGWGIAGAAWATLVSRGILAAIGIIMLFRKKNKIRPNFKKFKFNKKIIEDIISVGVPSTIGQSGASLGFIVLNGFIGSYGTATVAAFGMVNRITSLVMQPAMGIGAALTAIVGQNMGADQIDRVKESFEKALKLTISIGVVGGFFLLLFDKQLINFFIQSKDDPAVISLSLTYLFYTSLSMPLMGIFSVLQGIFQGTGHTKYSMAMGVGRLWFVRLPMILVFKHYTNFGSTGIWFAMAFSNLVVCIYGYLMYRRNKWQTKIMKTKAIQEV